MAKSKRLLAVSIGNTTISIGVLDSHGIVKIKRISGGAPFPRLTWAAPEAIAIASVTPQTAARVRRALQKRYGIAPLEIGRDFPVPMHNRCRFPRKVGVDRLLNALAARSLVACPVIVVDLGTAITIDAVSTRGDFLGGTILPGANLWTTSLHQHTAQLPLVDLVRPKDIVGKQTEEAIRAGVFWGVCGAVGEIVGRLRKRLRTSAPLVVTGGDADLFSPHLPDGHVVVPGLTLRGIGIAWDTWRERRERGG